MFCQKCGSKVPDGLYVCPDCGSLVNSAPVQPQRSVRIKNYMMEAILIIIFCSVPFGIVALVYACRVNPCIEHNDFAGAKNASDKARTWILVGLICGVIGTVIYASLLAAA